MVWFFMVLLNFEYYVQQGVVKRKRVDKELAKSLLKTSKDRFAFAKEIVGKHPKYALEMAYEAIIEIIDALLALEGYKSWSHEANLAFLSKIGFSEVEIRKLDVSRRKRHSSKYYGKDFDAEEVADELDFLEKIFRKLEKVVESRIS